MRKRLLKTAMFCLVVIFLLSLLPAPALAASCEPPKTPFNYIYVPNFNFPPGSMLNDAMLRLNSTILELMIIRGDTPNWIIKHPAVPVSITM